MWINIIYIHIHTRGHCVYNKNDIQYGSWMRMICSDSESIIYDRHSSDILRCLPSCNARWRLIACLSLVPCGALPSHQRVKFSKQKKGWAVMPSYMLRYMLARKQMKPEPPWTSNVGVGMDHWDILRLSQYIIIYSRYISWRSMMFHRVPWCWCCFATHFRPQIWQGSQGSSDPSSPFLTLWTWSGPLQKR